MQRALCSEFNTLAVMYGKPSEEFITQKPPYIITQGPLMSPSGAGQLRSCDPFIVDVELPFSVRGQF